MLVDMVSIDEFSNAYGLLLLVQGVSNLVGPPFAGYLYDISHIWYYTFGLGGTFISISGIIIVILPLTKWINSFMKQSERSQGQTQCEEDNSLEEAFCRNRENNAKRNDLHEKEYNHENGMNTTKDLNRAEMELILEDRIIPEKERSKRNVELGNPKFDTSQQISPTIHV